MRIFLPLFNRLLYFHAMATPPIIVVGMHRSGTTMLTKLLERCGVFMGIHQTGNRESIFFQNINRDALDILGCNWRCLDFLPETSMLLSHYQWLCDVIDNRLKNELVIKHWGWSALKFRWTSDAQWGWKDPRNSLMLPVWYKLFPNAVVLHIFRDGRDVALSLLTREIKREKGGDLFSRKDVSKRFIADVHLWENYLRRIDEGIQLFSNHYTLQFEKLLIDPLNEMEKLVSAIDLKVKPSLKKVISIIDCSRTERYKNDEYSWVTKLNFDSTLLKKLGYED